MRNGVSQIADSVLSLDIRIRGEKEVINEKSSVKEIEEEAKKMVQASRRMGYHVAADNLEYYLNAKKLPHTKTISRSWLRSCRKVKDAEKINLQRFQSDILDAINAKRTRVSNYWDRLISYHGMGVSQEELFFASGDSTLTSRGNFTITYNKENIKVRGTVVHRWYDVYDFHAGLGAYIPGFGYIPDAAMKKLVTKGNAGEYEMECKWKQELDTEIKTNSASSGIRWNWRIEL